MLSISSYLIPFSLNFFATALIYCGVLFMSAQLLPSLLESVYANTNITIRTVIAIIVCSTPANILISNIFKNNSGTVAGVTNIMAVVLVIAIVAILIDNVKINATILISIILVMATCANLIYQLQKYK